MASDEIIVRYKAVPEGFDKVGVAVNSVTQDTKELQTQIKATFADKIITEATANLDAHGDKVDEVGKKYNTAKAELRALTNEITSGKLGAKEMDAAVKRAADLTDHIGDVRNEIKKLSSDTRVFDLLAQGARGVAAGFSVATGLAASFGSENKDLQKTLMKVQGAMATLQGVQELANIATEKGGIATKAYGVALQVVDKISKVTGLSMAASWAVATAGLTILIAGVISLIAYLGQANEASDTYAKDEADRQKELAKKQKETQEEKMAEISAYEKKKFEEQEYWRKKEQIAGKDVRAVEVKQLEENIAYYKDFLTRSTVLGQEYFEEYKDLSKEQYQELQVIAGKYVIDAEIKRQDLLKDITKKGIKERVELAKREKQEEIGVSAFTLPDAPPKDYTKNFLEGVQEDINIQKIPTIPVKFEVTKKDFEDSLVEFTMYMNKYASVAQGISSSLAELTASIYEGETSKLEEEKNQQLSIYGDDVKKREAIEKRFAIKKAQLAHEAAAANKAFAIFQIGISTAQAVINALGSVPYTPANIALAAAVGAVGAAQLAAAAARPLPPVPKFEKGGEVLAGGRNADGHLIGRSHRDGGILINAQGGEYIWDIPTVQKNGDIIKAAHENRIEDLVFHKYVVPMMKAKEDRQNESYDDWLLRATIKSGQKSDRKNAEFIASKVSESVSSAIYNQNRYR